MPALSNDGPIWILDLGDSENRFSPTFLATVTEQLDDIASSADSAVLVTTATGKFFSNGLDLAWLAAHPEQTQSYVAQVQALLAKVLTFPAPTVAAVNGHAFGAGAMLAVAHDFRLMRQDRGFFCFPEVDINIPFTPGMAALIQAKLTPDAAVESMTTGRRYGGTEAAARGIVRATSTADALATDAHALAGTLVGKHKHTLGKIKSTMYAGAAAALTAAGA